MPTIKELHKAAQQLLGRGDFKTAKSYLDQVLAQAPEHADANFLLGIVYLETHQINRAIPLMEKALSLHFSDEYVAYLAKGFALKGDREKTAQCVAKTALKNIKVPRLLDTIGVALNHIDAHEQALPWFKKALQINTKLPNTHYNYGVSLTFIGEIDAARNSFEQAIQLNPYFVQAHYALSDLGGITPEKNNIKRLEPLVAKITHPDASLQLSHALAKEQEALGNYKQAFAILESAKKRKLQSTQYSFEQDQKLFDCVTSEALKQVNLTNGANSHAPIFVVGMPRTGTTLVERIISNHSKVTSAGELQDFGMALAEEVADQSGMNPASVLSPEMLKHVCDINMRKVGERYLQRTQALRGDRPYFIDKLHFNFFYLKQVFEALPHAKVVCLLRHPLDSCLGNFRQLFAMHNPHFHYSFELRSIGLFYARFWHFIQYWRKQQINNFYVLQYEELVNNSEHEIPKLINFCGLDWEETCLKFENNTASVSTASTLQVRQPLSKKYLNRWKNYEQECASLRTLLLEEGVEIPDA